MATMRRCKTVMEIFPNVGSTNYIALWPGLEVDFDRVLSPGFTLGDAVAGREDCFEPIDVSTAAPVPDVEE